MKSTQVTIKDIARELGISPSTVSRALKDHPDISPDTKKVVKELAQKLNYQPNIVALNLRQSKTNTIGIIVPELVHFFFSTVISGIEDVAYKNGYNVIISQSNESYEREVSDLKALFNSRVDGLLISVSRETSNFDHFKTVFERGMPMVFFDRAVDELDTSKIIVDDSDGAYQATKHLIEQGCKNIAHIAGPESLIISKKRTDGYIKALGDHNIMVDNKMIVPCNEGSIEAAKKIAMELLQMKNRPDGIFTSHDLTALGAMQAAKQLNIKIPEELAIIGFSNWQMASFTEPTLSSVDQPGYEMGKQAAELLLKEVESKEDQFIEPQTKILPTKLIIRESSKRK